MIKYTNTSIRTHSIFFRDFYMNKGTNNVLNKQCLFICLITQIIGFQDTVPKRLVRPTRSRSKCRRRKKFGEFTGN